MRSTFLHRKRRAVALLGVAALAATLAACATSTPGSNDSPGAGSTEQLKVLVTPTLDSLAAYVAKEKGYFADEGLDVEIGVGQGGKAISDALLAGEAQIGIVNYGSLISGAVNGLPLTLVSPLTLGGTDDFSIWVQPDSGIDTVADLKGKKIGVIATGSLADLLVNVQLAAAGLSASDVTYVTVPAPNFVSALTGGQVDAILMDVLTALQAKHEGAKLLTSAFVGESKLLPLGGFAAGNTWLASHPDVSAKFTAAIVKAGKLIDSDPSVVDDIIPTVTTVTADQLPELTLPTWATDQSVSDLQRVADIMYKYGMLSAPFDVSTIVAK